MFIVWGVVSVAVFAEISLTSPQTLFIFNIKNITTGSKFQNNNNLILKKTSLGVVYRGAACIELSYFSMPSYCNLVHTIACASVFVLARTSVRSPRKLLTFVIKKYIYWIKVSQKKKIIFKHIIAAVLPLYIACLLLSTCHLSLNLIRFPHSFQTVACASSFVVGNGFN